MLLRSQRCGHCQRTLRVYGSITAVGLTTLTAIAFLATYAWYNLDRLPSDSDPSMTALLIVLFLATSTLWFYLFGKPRLVSGWGIASKSKLEAERQAFVNDNDR